MLSTIQTIPPAAIEPAMDTVQRVRDLFADATLLGMLALLAGMLLLAFGRRLLSGIGGVAGLLAGAGLGLIASDTIGLDVIADVPTVVIFPIVGGIIGVLLAVLAVRFFSTLGAGFFLAIAGALGLAFFAQPLIHPETPPGETAPAATADAPQTDQTAPENDTGEAVEPNLPIAERWRSGVIDPIVAHWSAWTPTQRLRLLGVAAAGLVAGFLMGIFRPNAASAISASAIGSASIIAGLMLLDRWPTDAANTGRGVYTVWIALGCLGLTVQMLLFGRPRRGSSNDNA